MCSVGLLLITVAAALACLPTVPLDTVSLPATQYPTSPVRSQIPSSTSGSKPFETIPMPSAVVNKKESINGIIPKTTIKGSVISKVKGTGIEKVKVKSPCPVGWKKLTPPISDKCYKKESGRFDFNGAKRFCASQGGILPSILTKEEHNFIQSLGQTGVTSYLDDLPFIGLMRDDVIGGLKWLNSDGEGYFKFHEDNELKSEEGSCFMMAVDQTIANGGLLHGGQLGHYEAVDCFQETKTVICEIDL